MYEAPPRPNGAHYDDEGPTAWRTRVDDRLSSLSVRANQLEHLATGLKTIKGLLIGLVSIGLVAAGTFVVSVLQDQVRLEHLETRVEEHVRTGHPSTSEALSDLKGDVRALTVEMHTSQDAVLRRLDSLEERLSTPAPPRR